METTNFNTMKRGDNVVSNYRLMNEPVKLTTKLYEPYVVPDGDGWAETGAVCGVPVKVSIDKKRYSQLMRLRGSRKQRAAKAFIPRESIKVVSQSKPVAAAVGIAIYEGKTEQEIQIAQLEARIREVMGLVNKQKAVERRKVESTETLERVFEGMRTKV